MLRGHRMIRHGGCCRARIVLALSLLGVAVILAGPGAPAAFGMSVDEYRTALRDVRSEARDLDEATPERAAEIAAAVRTSLPGDEFVDLGGGEIPVQDAQLLDLAERLDERTSASGIRLAAGEVELRAQALLDAIGTGEPSVVPADQAALDEILGTGANARENPLNDLIMDFLQKVGEWLQELFSGIPSLPGSDMSGFDLSGAWPYIVAVAVAVAAGLLVRLVMWLAARRRMRSGALAEDEQAPVVAAAEDLPPDILAYADRLAGAGHFREAVRALFGGAARMLVDAGVIARTRTRTNGELLSDVRASAPDIVSNLDALARVYERAWYGRRDPGRAGLDLARTQYVALAEDAARWSGGGA